MLTETIGGKCPVCGYEKMLLRYGSAYYYKFDACPNCSFAFAHNDSDITDKGKDVWESVLDAYRGELERRGLSVDLQGLREWVEQIYKQPDDTIDTTVWCYECHELSDPDYFWLPMKKVKEIVAAENNERQKKEME